MTRWRKRRLKEIDDFISKTERLPEPKLEWEREANDIIRRARVRLQDEATNIRQGLAK